MLAALVNQRTFEAYRVIAVIYACAYLPSVDSALQAKAFLIE